MSKGANRFSDGYIFDADDGEDRKRKYKAKKRTIARRHRRKEKYKEIG
jgi:hypothetical protein